MIAQSLLKQIPAQNQLDPKYNIINYCNNLCKLPLLTFFKKVIVVIDGNTFANLNKICPGMQQCHDDVVDSASSATSVSVSAPAPAPVSTTSIPCLTPNLLEVVNLHSESPYFNTLRYADLHMNGDMTTVQTNNKYMLSLLLPDYNASAKNTNPSLGMGYGCQMVAMSFQTFDANMEYYMTYFNNAGFAFVYKPNYLRYVPQYITLPPPLPDSVNLEPQTATVETSVGSFDFATFPRMPSQATQNPDATATATATATGTSTGTSTGGDSA
jgi:hypothetical protein